MGEPGGLEEALHLRLVASESCPCRFLPVVVLVAARIQILLALFEGSSIIGAPSLSSVLPSQYCQSCALKLNTLIMVTLRHHSAHSGSTSG
ncbi:hypothetical protein E2C01_001753 [Portunus trituberculatus]|uniref:Uncharacterized protein n=1 Tax=Portunus trituberculatus TaxID=210409 RepID=A0A5B7CIE8_PORTR|nr:hypothetical protein [Portunus trituberculatus]